MSELVNYENIINMYKVPRKRKVVNVPYRKPTNRQELRRYIRVRRYNRRRYKRFLLYSLIV